MDRWAVQKHLLERPSLPYERSYMVAHDFAHDVRLIFKNCFLFNRATTPFRTAQKLCKGQELFAEEERAGARGPRCPPRARCQMLLTDLRRHPFTEWFRRAAIGRITIRAIPQQVAGCGRSARTPTTLIYIAPLPSHVTSSSWLLSNNSHVPRSGPSILTRCSKDGPRFVQ